MKPILFYLVAILFSTVGNAQLKVDTKYNRQDTTLGVTFCNTSQHITVIKNEFNRGDLGSYCEVSFIDKNGFVLSKGWYNYVHANDPKQMIVLHPQKEASFSLSFSMKKQDGTLKNTKKIRAKFWIKYSNSDGKKTEPHYMSFTKEFNVR